MVAAALVMLVAGVGVGLPRETRLKPTAVYAQYTQPADGRYGAATVAPQYGAPPTPSYDPFTQAPPAPADGGQGWNSPAPANPLRAPVTPTVDNSWNAGDAVARAADATPSGPIQRLGAEINNATAPIQEGFDRFGNQIRTAANNLGDQTNRLLDDLGRPLQRGAVPAAGSGAAAPPEPAAAETTNWNPGFTATSAPEAASGDVGALDWNQDELPANFRGAETAGSAPPFDATLEAPPLATGSLPPSRTATDGNRWTNPAALTTGGATPGTPPGEITTTWPGTGDATTGAGRFASDAPVTVPEGPLLNGPELREGMLGLPPDRQLEGVDPLASATATPFGAGASALATTSAPANSAPAPQNGTGSLLSTSGSQAPGQGWGASATTPASATPTSPTSSAASARDRAAVILAWVLLFSSVAGNVYLFWSYLDVRTKYRALVRKTARAVGSRFSAA